MLFRSLFIMIIKSAKRNFRACEECGHDKKNDEDETSKEMFVAEPISQEDNVLFYYCPVEKATVLTLNEALRQVSIELLKRSIQLSCEPPPIWLHISSDGGSLFDGLAAVDYIRKSKVPVYSVIDGAVASAATLMSIVAKKRFIHEHGYMLIHQISGGMWGSYSDLEDEMQNCAALMTTIKNIYQQYTKIPGKKLNEILKHDLWFDAKECLKLGLVDEIL